MTHDPIRTVYYWLERGLAGPALRMKMRSKYPHASETEITRWLGIATQASIAAKIWVSDRSLLRIQDVPLNQNLPEEEGGVSNRFSFYIRAKKGARNILRGSVEVLMIQRRW